MLWPKNARGLHHSSLTVLVHFKLFFHHFLCPHSNEQKLKFGFRKVYGDTVYRTLRATRVEKARQYFDQAEDNILQVANQVGYANASHFTAAFRDCFGMTPSVYLSNRK